MSDPHSRYRKAAGGLDALKSSYRALREQGIVGKGARTLMRANQPEGFDCPGCAWPDRNPHSTFEFCENGVKAVAAEATVKRIDAEFFSRHSVSELSSWSDFDLEDQGRLTEPLLYDADSDHYRPVSWEQAFQILADALNALESPDQALFYTSGRTSNEAAFLYQLFVREFGTNNLPDCSNMCHEPTSTAMPEQIGVGKGTVRLDDFEHAEAIFIFGQNPGSNHPRMLGELRSAAKRGCRIVAFNPLRERGLERFASPKHAQDLLSGKGVALATHYYTPRIGGDLAAVTGLLKALLEAEAQDRNFIDRHCEGFEALRAAVLASSWSAIEAESALSEAELREAAQVYIDSNATIICWGMGITQHRRSVATIQMLVNLLLVKGNIGKCGAGACPVRGHSNVQGDRTMGITEQPSEAFLDRLAASFGFQPPRAPGLDTIGAIEAMRDGQARVFFAMGGNFAAATPDTKATHRALKRCNLTAHVATKLNRSHLVHGRQALILPCLGRTEMDIQSAGRQAVTVEDSMSMVHLSAGMNAPAAPALLSEPMIVARLALATLPASRTPWLWLVCDYDRIRDRSRKPATTRVWLVCDYDRIRDRIAEVVEGFSDFNTRVRQRGGGFHLRNAAREREWKTSSGRANFIFHSLQQLEANVAAPLTLTTIRSHDQYNTTIYGLRDRYRGVNDERRVVFVSRGDLDRYGFKAGERVDLVSVWQDGERCVRDFCLVEYDIPVGCVAAYYPETNPLVPLDSHAERARTPTSKSIPVRLQRRSGRHVEPR